MIFFIKTQNEYLVKEYKIKIYLILLIKLHAFLSKPNQIRQEKTFINFFLSLFTK